MRKIFQLRNLTVSFLPAIFPLTFSEAENLMKFLRNFRFYFSIKIALPCLRQDFALLSKENERWRQSRIFKRHKSFLIDREIRLDNLADVFFLTYFRRWNFVLWTAAIFISITRGSTNIWKEFYRKCPERWFKSYSAFWTRFWRNFLDTTKDRFSLKFFLWRFESKRFSSIVATRTRISL